MQPHPRYNTSAAHVTPPPAHRRLHVVRTTPPQRRRSTYAHLLDAASHAYTYDSPPRVSRGCLIAALVCAAVGIAAAILIITVNR